MIVQAKTLRGFLFVLTHQINVNKCYHFMHIFLDFQKYEYF